jgi:hypothetical protein
MHKKLTVKCWRDLHGVATLFLVVDSAGNECARFPSEWEAEKYAAKQRESSLAGNCIEAHGFTLN